MQGESVKEKLEELYGAPSGYCEERRKAFFRIEKEPDEVLRELNEAAIDTKGAVYTLPCEEGTLLSIDL